MNHTQQNYLQQIKAFWIIVEACQLGPNEIALYFYLLEVWSKTGWAPIFKRNNGKIKSDLTIKSYKTMNTIRCKLQEARVIKYTQKNGATNAEYEMTDLSKFYQGREEIKGDSNSDLYPNLGKNYLGQGKGDGDLGTDLAPNLGKNYRVNINETISLPAHAREEISQDSKSTDLPPIAINPNRPTHAPTLTEVETYFASVNQPGYIRSFFEHYEGRGWVDPQGRPLVFWVSRANTWISDNIEREQKKAVKKPVPPKPNTSASSDPTIKTVDQLLAERRAKSNQSKQ